MDVNGSSRKRHVKSVATARLLGVLRHAPPFSDSGNAGGSDDLTEEDIFWSDDLAAGDHHFLKENGLRRFSSSSNLRHSHRKVSAFGSTDSFAFLAALPDLEKRTVFNRKASITSASASSPQMIPRRAQDRMRYRSSSSLSGSTANYHLSLPIRVPMMPMGMIRTRRLEFYEVDVDDEQGDEEMLPPHEMVARTWQRSYSRIAAFSVLEGAGRTLKGRDLHQVRNAVWRRTGFLD